MTDPVLSVAEMRAAEQAAMDAGVSEWELMRRAGEGAAQFVWRAAAGRPVTVLCGPGNNGGDGYVIAEWLRERGVDVALVAPAEPASETARKARSRFAGTVDDRLPPSRSGVMVDCLFGYGLSRKVEGAFAELLEEAHASHSYRIAIDVPSGIESDTGEWLGAARDYDLTLALGAWKRAHFLMPGCAAMGALRLVPIGLNIEPGEILLSDPPRFYPPAPDSHKYRRGLATIVAGAMPGAALLAARAAMHGGAGYVKLLAEHSHPDAPADLVLEHRDPADALSDERIAAVLVGPGLGRDEAARDRLRAALASGHRLVLDADALHLLDRSLLDTGDASRIVVTPHEGELAALAEAFGVAETDKIGRARALRDATSLTVLAKGPDTLLAPGAGGLVMFPRATSWLSVAGSGDVLAGVLASRLAVHGDPARAAGEAVWLHRAAGQIAAPPFTAGDLADAVRPAFASFL